MSAFDIWKWSFVYALGSGVFLVVFIKVAEVAVAKWKTGKAGREELCSDAKALAIKLLGELRMDLDILDLNAANFDSYGENAYGVLDPVRVSFELKQRRFTKRLIVTYGKHSRVLAEYRVYPKSPLADMAISRYEDVRQHFLALQSQLQPCTTT